MLNCTFEWILERRQTSLDTNGMHTKMTPTTQIELSTTGSIAIYLSRSIATQDLWFRKPSQPLRQNVFEFYVQKGQWIRHRLCRLSKVRTRPDHIGATLLQNSEVDAPIFHRCTNVSMIWISFQNCRRRRKSVRRWPIYRQVVQDLVDSRIDGPTIPRSFWSYCVMRLSKTKGDGHINVMTRVSSHPLHG